MNNVLEVLQANWEGVRTAPFAFFVCVALVGVLTLWGVWKLKANQIDDLTSRLALRDDEIADYKRKLEGKTPDEVRAQIDGLKKRLEAVEPKTLTDEAIGAIVSVARRQPGSIKIRLYLDAPVMATLQNRLGSGLIAKRAL